MFVSWVRCAALQHCSRTCLGGGDLYDELRRDGSGCALPSCLLSLIARGGAPCGAPGALRPLRRWISRQLLTARLHHPAWPLVALGGTEPLLAEKDAAAPTLAVAIAAGEVFG